MFICCHGCFFSFAHIISHISTHTHTFSPTSIILFCANCFFFLRSSCCCLCCHSFRFPQLQSLIWIAMSIMAILAYYCIFNFRGMIASLGTLTELTLFRMYFHGGSRCKSTDRQFVCYEQFIYQIKYVYLSNLQGRAHNRECQTSIMCRLID